MQMKQNILLGVAFVVSIAIGYGVTKAVSGSSEKERVYEPYVEVAENKAPVPTQVSQPKEEETQKKETPTVVPTEKSKEEKQAVKEKTKKEEKPPTDVKSKKAAVISALNNVIRTRSSKYPRGVSYAISGNGPSEHASSMAMVYDYLKMGVWSSARVTDVDLSPETGKVTKIYIHVTRGKHQTGNSDDNANEEL